MTFLGEIALINAIILFVFGIMLLFLSSGYYPGNTDGDRGLGIGLIVISLIILFCVYNF